MNISEFVRNKLQEIQGCEEVYNTKMMIKIHDYIIDELMSTSATGPSSRDLYYKAFTSLVSTTDIMCNELAKQLFNLSLEDGSYLKYFIIDELTEGKYLPLLIKAVVNLNRSGVNFRYHLNLNNMLGYINTKLHIESIFMDKIRIFSFIYEEPITGVDSLETAISSLYGDLFGVLDISVLNTLTIEKFYSGAGIIEVNRDKSIQLVYRFGHPTQTLYHSMFRQFMPNINMGIASLELGEVLIGVSKIVNKAFNTSMDLEYFTKVFNIPAYFLTGGA